MRHRSTSLFINPTAAGRRATAGGGALATSASASGPLDLQGTDTAAANVVRRAAARAGVGRFLDVVG